MRSVGWLLALTVAVATCGCSSVPQMVLSPRGYVQKLSKSRLTTPVRPDFTPCMVDPNADPVVRAEDIVGRWKYGKNETRQLINYDAKTEEVKKSIYAGVLEFRADGSMWQYCKPSGIWMLEKDIQDGSLWRYGRQVGTWNFVNGRVAEDFSMSGGRAAEFSVRRINDGQVVFRWVNVDQIVRNWGRNVQGLSKSAAKGGYEADGCFRLSVDYIMPGDDKVLYKETLVTSPLVYTRLGAKGTQSRLEADWLKNLRSLRDTGVITEEEYGKEMKRSLK